jgi:NhaC family Na+:H+ antiporter
MTAPADLTPRAIPVWLALVPVATLVALLYVNVQVFGSSDNHVALVTAAAVAALIAVVFLKRPWKELEQGILHSIQMAMQAILILLVVGMLIAAWIQAGVVPLMIVYGLKLISPSIFLVTSCLVCSVVSLATGSSWTTAGTVGVALIGVGTALGVSPGLSAGAIVSGAYFGDKMSPLSDTTNLAPAMAGSTLVEHVRHMIWTVAPALTIALVLYALLGGHHDAGPEALARIDAVIATLTTHFTLSPWLLIPPALVLVLVARNFPALPALFVGTGAAVVLGLAVQPFESLGQAGARYAAILYSGYSLALVDALPPDANEVQRQAAELVQGLLDGRGGMKSMIGTVALILCALSFGGVMERSGMLGALANRVLSFVRGTGSLVAATVATCFGINVLASDQYMAIVVPGRMFRTAFLERGLHPKNLSRCLEDSGTVTSALVPWNTCGQTMAGVLGVATGLYWKFAFLNWLCPLVSIAYGFLGFTITRISAEEAERRLRG